MQATKYHIHNIRYRLGKVIKIFFFELEQGRRQAVTASSNTDTRRSTEQSPRTDAQNLLERAPIICCLSVWWGGTLCQPLCTEPMLILHSLKEHKVRNKQTIIIVSASCIWESLRSIHQARAGKKAKQKNIHSVKNHICPLDASFTTHTCTSLSS